ncbi:MAG: hypothetical protein ABR575_09490, partial [Actinomycetota bacterium]
LGASFAGAEWGAGTMSTLLTWEPRRWRVLTSKVVAGVVFVIAGTVVAQALMGFALVPAAILRGTTEGAGSVWLWDTVLVGLRGAGVAGVAAAIGFAVASVARNTAAAIVVGFLYLSVIEGLIRGFRPRWQPWLLGDNAALFVVGEREFADLHHSAGVAGLILLAYALGAVAIALGVFRARDVT